MTTTQPVRSQVLDLTKRMGDADLDRGRTRAVICVAAMQALHSAAESKRVHALSTARDSDGSRGRGGPSRTVYGSVTAVQTFLKEFYDQNPVSQLALVLMWSG